MSIDSEISNIVLMAMTIVATSYVGWQSCLRSGFRRRTVLMELFRFLLIGLATFTLFAPTFVVQREPEGRSVLRVLVDNSASMNTEDVVRNGATQSRATAIEAISQEEAWTSSQTQHEVEIESFAARSASANAESSDEESSDSVPKAYSQSATDIHHALEKIARDPGDVDSIVLISDGDWNTGDPPSLAARKLRQIGIPVHTVGTGSPVALPDLALTNFDLPTFAVVGKPLRIPFTVASTMTSPVDLDVEVMLPEGEPRTVSLQVPAQGTAQAVVSWRPSKIGSFHIAVRVPGQPEERGLANNEQRAPIEVRYESLRVLMVDSYPRWEYRYTRNALMRDPGVTVHTLLLHPDLPEVGGGEGYLESFPNQEELSQYDVVFFGDVGIGEGQLTEEQGSRLVRLVRNQASGLIFLPGFRGFQSTLQGSAVEELLPVELDPENPKGVRSPTSSSFRLTEKGRESLLTRFESDADTNSKIWGSLPGFYWHAPVVRSKPNTSVLAVHHAKSNRFGRLPLIVTRTFGTGKILFVGSDSAWRWRKGVEDLYHYRFWSQMVRWMAYQRTMSAGDSMRVMFTPDRPRSGDTVSVLVNAMDENGEPLQSGTITTQVIMPSGKTETLNLKSDQEQSWGLFRSSFVAEEGGELNLRTRCRETQAEIETVINVRGMPLETIGSPARLEVMEEIASITRGTSIHIDHDNVSSLVDSSRLMPPRESTEQRYRLWSHPLWALLLIVLLGTFWILRKGQGLI